MTGPVRATAAALLAVALLGGCALGDRPEIGGDVVSPTRCGTTAPNGVANEAAGLSDRMVPGEPSTALVCRYRTNGTVGEASLVDATVVGALRDQFNALPLPSPTVADCPVEPDDQAVVVFRGDDDVAVLVRFGGCASATNGQRQRVATPQLIAAIDTLVPA